MHTNYAEQYFGKAQVYLFKNGVDEFIEENSSLSFPRAMIVSALDHTLIITGFIFISIENLAQAALNLLGVMFNFLSCVCGYNGHEFDCSYGEALGSLDTALFTAALIPTRIALLPFTWSYHSFQIMNNPKDAESYFSFDDDE
jgi:hypothetical protein